MGSRDGIRVSPEIGEQGLKCEGLEFVTQLQLSTVVKKLGKQIPGGAVSVLRLGTQVDGFSRQFDKRGAGGIGKSFEPVFPLR